jgi:hypothetical protein
MSSEYFTIEVMTIALPKEPLPTVLLDRLVNIYPQNAAPMSPTLQRHAT